MKVVGAYEAKTHLARLLDEVARGERITITKRGKPVAELVPAFVPPTEEQKRRARKASEEWDRYRREHNITLGPDLTIKQLIEEGRRY